MGWTPCKENKDYWRSPEQKAWNIAHLGSESGPWEAWIAPRYSTDIAAAWEVFEKLGGMHGVGYAPIRKEWTAYFQINIDHPTHRASDKSAAKAICLAALEAVGVDVLAAQPAQKQGEPK
jgi:hypothetical protein